MEEEEEKDTTKKKKQGLYLRFKNSGIAPKSASNLV